MNLERIEAIHSKNASDMAEYLAAADLGVEGLTEEHRQIVADLLGGVYVTSLTENTGLDRLRKAIRWTICGGSPEALGQALAAMEAAEVEAALDLLRRLQSHVTEETLERLRLRIVTLVHCELARRASLGEIEVAQLKRMYGGNSEA